jgi:formamidopyrimidine-DNA glycosylase
VPASTVVPELPEVECYRRLAERTVGRRIVDVELPDRWYVKGTAPAEAIAGALAGTRVRGARRIGKLLLVDTDRGGATVGLRFGMTGRLLVDGTAALDHLEHGSAREVEAWDRVVVRFDRGDLRVRDPRRLGGIQLEPDVGRLGVDALEVTRAQLASALGASTAPLKARLTDQTRVAGIGNLLADEILWRAGLDPARPAGSLDAAEVRRLHRHLAPTVRLLIDRGGSHTGDLQPERRAGGHCPRDGAPLLRRTVGGRTTWSCPTHQR